jgi:hypothetical protein
VVGTIGVIRAGTSPSRATSTHESPSMDGVHVTKATVLTSSDKTASASSRVPSTPSV